MAKAPRPNVTLAVRKLVRDLARRLPELAHVRASRVLVVAGEARGLSRASIGPAPGLRPRKMGKPQGKLQRKGSARGAAAHPTVHGKPVLYVMTLRPLWFLASTPEERVATVIHELYHLSSRFDGGLHAGRKHAKISRQRYDRRVRELLGRYLARAPHQVLAPFAHQGAVKVRMFLRRSRASAGRRRPGARELSADLFTGFMPMERRGEKLDEGRGAGPSRDGAAARGEGPHDGRGGRGDGHEARGGSMKAEVRLPLTATGRLDRAVADALGVGRAAVKQAFALGEVRVRGRRARASDPAAPGALVEVELEAPAGPPEPEAEAPLTVLAEGPAWLVADKPAGVATHPLREGEGGTLANAVVARYPECAQASPDPRDGGALQRLDLETSGCVLFARDRAAWESLRTQLSARAVEKDYLALAAGRVSSGGVCSVALAQRAGRVVPVPDPERPPRSTARPRPAETRYEVREALPGPHAARGAARHRGHAPDPGPPRLPGRTRWRATRSTGVRRRRCPAWRATSCTPPGSGSSARRAAGRRRRARCPGSWRPCSSACARRPARGWARARPGRSRSAGAGGAASCAAGASVIMPMVFTPAWWARSRIRTTWSYFTPSSALKKSTLESRFS